MNEPENCGEISTRLRIHEKNSGRLVRRLRTIIQSIFCAQSGASIRLTVWKWFGENRYPGAFPPVLETFRRAFSPGPTECPWVSEDVNQPKATRVCIRSTNQSNRCISVRLLFLFCSRVFTQSFKLTRKSL